MIDAREFLEITEKKQVSEVRFGTIAANHTSGRPTIIFDGSDVATVKKYPYLSSYIPAANDRVMVVKGVVVGKSSNLWKIFTPMNLLKLYNELVIPI